MHVRAITPFIVQLESAGVSRLYKFEQNEVIRDDAIAEEVKRLNCPVADLNDNAKIMCPGCRTINDVVIDAHEVSAAASKIAFSFGERFWHFETGQVIHPNLVPAAIKANAPIVTGNGIKCHRCKLLFI